MSTPGPVWLAAPRQDRRFHALLVMIFVVILLMPLGTARVGGGRMLLELLFLFMLLSAVYSVGSTPVKRYASLAMVAGVVVCQLIGFQVAGDVLSIVLLTYCWQQLLWYVLAPGPVGADKLLASLCVYMLMGLLFAEAYSTLEQQMPGSFRGLAADSDRTPNLPILVELNYFSFVTQATLGYGDIAPVNPFARTLAMLQAIVGQLYLAVLVARLVALHLLGRIAEAADDEAASRP